MLDLYVEFRCLTNGTSPQNGANLLGALLYFGLPTISAQHKDAMRDLTLRGGPWSQQEQLDLLDYCETDVTALEMLLPAMLPTLDIPRALMRGRWTGLTHEEKLARGRAKLAAMRARSAGVVRNA